jgi:hypothetical protein
MNDLRFALRQLRKSPGFTIIAVLTLALGIGANSAIFSVVNHVLLRPLPYPHPERLVYLNEVTQGTDTSIALPDYVDWRKDSKSFEHLAMSRLESRNLSGIPGREPERIPVAYVTANFFNVIGLPPQSADLYRSEDKPGAPSLAVISDRLWDRASSRPQVVGRRCYFMAPDHRHRGDAAGDGFTARGRCWFAVAPGKHPRMAESDITRCSSAGAG